tara:strand:- start:322 stop:468 length:147 start_codon:yes stop_codon:yes gene_type:complete
VFRDDEVIEQAVSHPNIEAYAKPIVPPINVSISVNFILEIKKNYNDKK